MWSWLMAVVVAVLLLGAGERTAPDLLLRSRVWCSITAYLSIIAAAKRYRFEAGKSQDGRKGIFNQMSVHMISYVSTSSTRQRAKAESASNLYRSVAGGKTKKGRWCLVRILCFLEK